MTTDDPLADADVGETRQLSHVRALSLYELSPREWTGVDRQTSAEIADVEIIEGDALQDDCVQVVLRAEATRVLPRNAAWLIDPDARTVTQRRTQRRRIKWLTRAGSAGLVTLMVTGASYVSYRVMGAMAGEVVINGEPFPEPQLGMFGTVGLIALLSILLVSLSSYRSTRGGVSR